MDGSLLELPRMTPIPRFRLEETALALTAGQNIRRGHQEAHTVHGSPPSLASGLVFRSWRQFGLGVKRREHFCMKKKKRTLILDSASFVSQPCSVLPRSIRQGQSKWQVPGFPSDCVYELHKDTQQQDYVFSTTLESDLQ
uniref:Uncharacterized protein n=1 Tax=Coccidioides posadasii RMSCC 3488 TaxID=454284 RepID=A0A0J6IHB3_COCPO|nr:hypothetical protein CPAG_07519 [Coccidioides posadasii RMSCC 3488]